jgi:hypothetical protein
MFLELVVPTWSFVLPGRSFVTVYPSNLASLSMKFCAKLTTFQTVGNYLIFLIYCLFPQFKCELCREGIFICIVQFYTVDPAPIAGTE